jgi:hypothetical protein
MTVKEGRRKERRERHTTKAAENRANPVVDYWN